jgi:hypothetical protein
MSLRVTERQKLETWYELSGDIEARDLFPTLLPTSNSLVEADEIETEHDIGAGRYDGFDQPDYEMRQEIAEFTESALVEFHSEALAAAKAALKALTAGETLLHKNFKDQEVSVLEEAAKALGVVICWDPVGSIVYAQKCLAAAQMLLQQNTSAIAMAKKRNKLELLLKEENLRPARIERVEEARRKLESLMAETANASKAGSPADTEAA